ncbi:MAG: hypothetical protein GXO69_08140 [Acidobacteria bacterium]|nr:hypothetical protein [Acidobacteriota bacterium]
MSPLKQFWYITKIIFTCAVVMLTFGVSQVRANSNSQDGSTRLKAVFRNLLDERSLYKHPGNWFSYDYIVHISVIPDGEAEPEFCMIFAKGKSGEITMVVVVPQGPSFRKQLLSLSQTAMSFLSTRLKFSRVIYTSRDFPILKQYALNLEGISLKSIPPSVLVHATQYEFSIHSLFQRTVIHLETIDNFDDPCSYNALLQWLKEIRAFLSRNNSGGIHTPQKIGGHRDG